MIRQDGIPNRWSLVRAGCRYAACATLLAACTGGDAMEEDEAEPVASELGVAHQALELAPGAIVIGEKHVETEHPTGPPRVQCSECEDLWIEVNDDGVLLTVPAGFDVRSITLEYVSSGGASSPPLSRALALSSVTTDGELELRSYTASSVPPADAQVRLHGWLNDGEAREYLLDADGLVSIWPPLFGI